MELSPVLTMILGALLIGIGGHLSANVPNQWAGKIIKSHAKIYAVIFGLLGIAMVGGGGTLTTYAWNALDRADAKKAIIISVSRELGINAHLYYENNLFSNDSILLEGWAIYPRFRSEAIQYAVVSSLFNISDSLDNELLNKLRETDVIIYNTNIRLQALDDLRLKETDYKLLDEKKRMLNNSYILQDFKDDHNRLAQLIITNYPWAIADSVVITLPEK